MNRIFHILTLLLLNFTAMAQRYPVTVTPVLLPPYTVNLADLVEDKGKPKIMTTIMVNDLTVKNLRVRLHVKMESSGVTIENIKNTAVSPMFIGGGETRILTGIDLAQYLKLDNLEFHGYSKEKYLQTGQLPGGLWRLTIEIQDFDSGRQLSNRGMFTAWVSVYDPPQLLAPRDNVEAPDNASLPLVFSWLASKHTGGIVPVQYKLEVWRLNMEYLPAQTWVESQTPIYTASTSATSFTAIPAALNLEPGQRYCWRVTVIDPTGQAQINKDGESEVRTFVYQHTCPDVTDIDISVNNTRVDFSWNGSNQHSYYQVDLVDMNGSSTLKDCYDTRFTYYDFERGSNWKVSVKAVCPGGLESDWATYQDFSIDPPGTTPTVEECPDCGCAEAPEQQAIENQNLKELKANDTIVNRTGRTRFIIVNATANGDGSYNGQFHLWLELWKVKVLCDYTDLKVNTDGVILDGQWRSVNNPALMINTAELASAVVQLKNDIATVTYDNSIRDTVMLVDAIQTIYKDEEGHYQAVLDNGEVKDVTTQLENKGRTLITDSEGNRMVLTSDHQIMSAEQYKATGKNSTLISNSNSEKDKQISTGKVMFSSVEAQKYGFDAYSADNAYDAVYPVLEGGYRPAYKSIAKWQSDVVTASPMDKVSFRNQMGAPYAVKNGTIELRGDATPGESPVYAHVAETDSTTKVVGKLNLLTFDEKQVQLCLVPVNGARLPNATQLQAELNSIFAPAVASVKVTTHGGVTIGYANGKNFVHGGSGWLSVYNTDQKTAIDALTDAQDDVYYLFFVDNAVKLDPDGNRTIVAGYMPICRRYGFIYDNPTSKYVAHEVSHGAFSLHHTFSDESESYHAPQGTTPNLMDYSGGTALNHLQWQWMHESHTNLLGFLDDESEGEAWSEGTRYKCISTELATRIKEKYRYFYYPDGSIVDMKDHLPSGFYLSTDVDAVTSYGAVATIREGDRDLFYDFSRSNNNANVGYGYRLNGNAICKYKLPSISSEKASELNPVHVRLKENQVTIIDFMGHELESFVDDVCDCQMAEYTFSSELEPIVEDENQEYWFYDKKENKIVIVSKVHDLSWVKTKGSISYDEVMEFTPGEIRMTEAQLADSKYNWLRNDVIKAMNEGGKIVMVGLAVTALAPYLIEYAAMYGEEVFLQLLTKFGEKAIADFTIGAGQEAFCYYLSSKITDTPIDKKDMVGDIILSGVNNVIKSRGVKTVNSCISATELHDWIDCFSVDNDCPWGKIGVDCIVGGGLEFLSSSKKISELRKNIVKSEIVNKLKRLSNVEPEYLLEIYGKLCGDRTDDWMQFMRNLMKEEQGKVAFNIILNCNIDFSKITRNNWTRLSEIVKKYGGDDISNSLIALFSQKRDVNGLLTYMSHLNCNPKQFIEELNKIALDERMFKKFRNSSKTVGDYFFNTDSECIFYSLKNNEATFIKCAEDLSEGVMFVVKLGETTIEKVTLQSTDIKLGEDIERIYEKIFYNK